MLGISRTSVRHATSELPFGIRLLITLYRIAHSGEEPLSNSDPGEWLIIENYVEKSSTRAMLALHTEDGMLQLEELHRCTIGTRCTRMSIEQSSHAPSARGHKMAGKPRSTDGRHP
jgi:hypothetical protein